MSEWGDRPEKVSDKNPGGRILCRRAVSAKPKPFSRRENRMETAAYPRKEPQPVGERHKTVSIPQAGSGKPTKLLKNTKKPGNHHPGFASLRQIFGLQ